MSFESFLVVAGIVFVMVVFIILVPGLRIIREDKQKRIRRLR